MAQVQECELYHEFEHLHPEKYARDAKRVFLDFIEGLIDYPEVDLKLAGDEAWSDAFPPLRKAIHDLVRLIRTTVHEKGLDGMQIPNEVRYEIFEKAKPILSKLEAWSSGLLR